MYDNNHLLAQLRIASIGREDAVFAYTDSRGQNDGHLLYGELFAGAEKMAAALVDAGLLPGDRAAAQVEKSLPALQLYLGTVLAGGVFLPLNTAYTASEVAYFLGDATPRVLICDPEKREQLMALPEVEPIASVMCLDAEGKGSLAKTAAAQPTGFSAVTRGADDLAAILYTSGTTGRSKGAMLSHANLASNSAVLKDYWLFSADDVLLHALPIFHTHGLFVATNIMLIAGGALIFMPRFDSDAVIEALPRATAMMGVPTFYTRLLEHPALSKDLVAHMRLFVSGSAPLLAETHQRWTQITAHHILERYGMTETNMNTSNPYDGDRIAGTVGFPLPGVELIICDAVTGEPVPQGEIGIIEVRGDSVFQGYWQMPEKTAEELRPNGFFITGDMAVMDERGYVSIVGRSKDLIISGGFNIYPKEIEGALDDVEGVVESAVIGLPHADFGEGVAAVVVSHADADTVRAAITAQTQHCLAKFKQPKVIFVVDELPRNAMGKVQKNLLREQYHAAFAKH